MRLRTWLAFGVIAVFGLIAAFQSRSTPVFAQLDTLEFEVATPGVEESPATDAPSATPSEIEAATNRYFAAVEAYRLEENRYGLARDQYYQLNTLAALDEAIRRGREVLRARAEVLNAYFSYLRLILQNTKGIDLNDKAVADAELEAWQTKLEGYVEQIPQVSDRVQLNTAFTTLNDESRTIKSTAYGTLVLIKIGEIQTAADTARILQDRTSEAVQNNAEMSAAQKEISTRGLNEISLLLQRANNNTFTLLEDYREQKNRGDFTESGYRSFQSNAEFSYLELRQVVDYLREIQKTL